MNTFFLKDVRSDAALRLSALAITPGAEDHFVFNAAFEAMGATVYCAVDDYYLERWGNFFSDVASCWRGWSGNKTCSSTNDAFRLSMTTDALGHVEVSVTIGSPYVTPVWTFTGKLAIDAGQLEAVARSAVHFFAKPVQPSTLSGEAISGGPAA